MSSVDGDDDGYTPDEYTTAVIVSVIVCIFAGMGLGILFTYMFCKSGSALASK